MAICKTPINEIFKALRYSMHCQGISHFYLHKVCHSFTLLGGTIPAFAFQVDLGAAAEAAKAEP